MKYLILGAGPAGLSFANRLLQKGETSFLVLEQENEAGGLCRSAIVDDAPLDIGGGHFLDVRRPEVNKFLFEFMPESEWNIFERDSRIALGNEMINHPIEANIWQLDIENQVEYLESISQAGCNTKQAKPEYFIDWIYWKLGDKIAESYMIPYNQKMFGTDLDDLGTYWLEKLPNVSFRETLLSCLEKRAYGTQPGHAKFYYPKKYGYGELWRRMADNLGSHIEYGKKINSIDFKTNQITTVDNCVYKADWIITTIPWMEYKTIIGMPEELENSISKLRFSSVQIDYYASNLDTECHWIYYPDDKLAYHRILVRHNFCTGSRGYWTETNSSRLDLSQNKSQYSYLNKYAYPLNTVSKPEIMNNLLKWTETSHVIGLGRWGEHQHYNSDVTVDLAMKLADKMHLMFC